jgi:hypothetical protein
MYSGGIGSWAAAQAIQRDYDRVTLLFTDVLGEDEDCYRFIRESAAAMPDADLVWLTEGRTIWQVFKDDKFLGNSRLANCSKFLKQRPAKEWVSSNTSPEDTTIVIGIDWTETHRIPAVERAYEPWPVRFPLTEDGYRWSKDEMLTKCREAGIEPPRMYAQGYPHANCGGGCVRAGIGQFRKLLEINPDRYAEWERNEREVREHLGRDDVAILKDRRGGVTKPMTLTQLRRRVECGQDGQLDLLDIGGCGCFVQEEQS